LNLLAEQTCTFCHQPDGARHYVLPVRYEDHCAGCHALTTRPAGDWPADDVRAWAAEPLPHPGRSQTAAVVRGALLARYWKLIAGLVPDAPQLPRPPLLDRPLPPLTAEQRERVRSLAEQTEKDLFPAATGGQTRQQTGDLVRRLTDGTADDGVLGDLEHPLFVLRGGCSYCHERTGTRPDGLPEYAPPRLRDRWEGLAFPQPLPGPPGGRRPNDAEQAARNRWFPYARFDHASHRLLDCISCHKNAATSSKTADVLMPAIADCRACHNPQVGVRSDCLECHDYHDRARQPRSLRGPFTIDDALHIAWPTAAPAER
jgi:hypothetical protein